MVLLLRIAVPCLMRIFSDFSPRGPGFDPGSVRMGILLRKSDTAKDSSPGTLVSPLSVSFHECSILIYLSPTLYNRSSWQHHYITDIPSKPYGNSKNAVRLLSPKQIFHYTVPSSKGFTGKWAIPDGSYGPWTRCVDRMQMCLMLVVCDAANTAVSAPEKG
jgi:hypothetical protein